MLEVVYSRKVFLRTLAVSEAGLFAYHNSTLSTGHLSNFKMADSWYTEAFQAFRITKTSGRSFETVVNRLRCQTNPQGQPLSEIFKPHKPYSEISQAEYIQYINNKLGPSGFMYFHELEYGSWINLFDIGGGMRMKRFIIGNPLIAITILEHEMRAALSVPVELLVRELEDGIGTEVVYLKPSGVIRGDYNGNGALKGAAEALDRKLESLVDAITS